MDIDSTWSEILAIVSQPMTSESADRFSELADALDQWLAHRGYAPVAWPEGTAGHYRHACAYAETVAGMCTDETLMYAAWFVAEWATDIDTDTSHTREVPRFRRAMAVSA